MATYEQIVEANRATFAAWNAHDPEAEAAIYAAEAVVRDVGTPDVLRGRAAIRERAADLGMQATGNAIQVEGATFSRFDSDGLVVEDVTFWDVGALLARLGGAP